MHYALQSIELWWFMTVHLKKLSVGSASIDSLRELQAERLASVGRLVHITRNRPRRVEELLDGGSIYWIIRGVMTARQVIIDFVEAERSDGSLACGIVLSPEIVTVAPKRMRIFQGWRYLEVTDVPIDIDPDNDGNMPSEFAAELRELGIF